MLSRVKVLPPITIYEVMFLPLLQFVMVNAE